jgi:hypothetical protein
MSALKAGRTTRGQPLSSRESGDVEATTVGSVSLGSGCGRPGSYSNAGLVEVRRDAFEGRSAGGLKSTMGASAQTRRALTSRPDSGGWSRRRGAEPDE